MLFFAATGVGQFLAAAVMPVAVRRWGRYRTANGALALAALIELAGAGLHIPMMVACGFLLGLAGQVVKLCVDSAMQLDVDDALRGHVFAVQDALFWMSFILAMALAAVVIPPDGHEPALVLAGPGSTSRASRCTPSSAGALPRRAKVTDMAAAEPMVADLQAESDALDALVADLPPDALGAAHARTGLDDRPSDCASAVDRPRRADVRHRRSGLRERAGRGGEGPHRIRRRGRRGVGAHPARSTARRLAHHPRPAAR